MLPLHWRSVGRLFQVCGTSAILQVSVFGSFGEVFCLWSFGLWRGRLGGSQRTLGLVARFLSLVFWLVARPSGRVSPHFGCCGEASVFGLLACGEALWEGLSTLWILWRGFRVWSFGLWRGPLGGSLHTLGLVARLLCLVCWLVARPSGRVSPHFGSCGEASVLSLATRSKVRRDPPRGPPHKPKDQTQKPRHKIQSVERASQTTSQKTKDLWSLVCGEALWDCLFIS